MAILNTPAAARIEVAPGPLVLIGAPPLLRGSVHLSNPGGEKLKLKTAALRLDSKAWGDPHRPLQLAVGARLAAGGAVHAPVSVAIDPRTPPGEVRGEVSFGDDGPAREIVLKVLERRAVAVTPSRFEVHGQPGEAVTLPVVITNLGNVPFTVPRVALVALGEDQAFTQLFHVAMARKGGEGHQAALDAFVELLGATEVDAAKAVIVDGGGTSLAPGEPLSTGLRFELPVRLARHRVYQGSFTIGKTQCDLEIEVADETAATPVVARRTPKERKLR